MITKRIDTSGFKPVTIEVTIETQEEADALDDANRRLTRGSVKRDLDNTNPEHVRLYRADVLVRILEQLHKGCVSEGS